jgi:beta-glucosidase-like glycosyl hydrolase
MPLTAPETYELDRSEDPLMQKNSFDEESGDSDVDEFDPLKNDRPYTDDASKSSRTAYSEKAGTFTKQPLRWLDSQREQSRLRRWLIPSRFCCCLMLLFFVTLLLLLSAGGIWVYKVAVPDDGESEPWYPSPRGGTLDAWKDSYKKAAALVGQMTLVEKVNITTGVGFQMGLCLGNTGDVERLGFPSLCLHDGPLGLRHEGNSTAWPAGITVGATWNKDLMYERGKGHGFEAKMKGVNVILGPSMGPLGRMPAGGRNWEGFGTDPVLQGIAAAQTIKGIQDAGVIATAKHYVANEQEHFRQAWEWGIPNAISSNIDDRTLHEIYAWPFADSIRAGVASVMCSYNQLNNSYACQNSKLMNGILKDEMGFQGFVQSDWLAQRSGVASALSGLDMSMPGDGLGWQDGKSLWGPELTKAVLNISVPMERLNDMVTRVVAAWYQLGQDDKTEWPPASEGGGPNFSSWTNETVGNLHPGSPDSKDTGVVNKYIPVRNTTKGGDHDTLARKIAAEGIVLVKNTDKILPLSRDGKGVIYKPGKDKITVGIFGEDAFAIPEGINSCKDRACNEGTLTMGWGSGAVELPYLVTPAEALHANFNASKFNISEVRTNDADEAAKVASKMRTCMVFVNSDAGEGFAKWNGIKGDRNHLKLQKDGDQLIKKVAASCENTIVVVHTVGPVILEEWIDMPAVKGVLIAHLPGQESGNALADVIFGDVNPSGRLPYTIAKSEEDYGPTSYVMYYPNGVVPQQNFSEGMYIDYRYFDKYNITPRYEFGYGLSYVDFKLNSLIVNTKGAGKSLPKARPKGLNPPKMDNSLPSVESAIWPAGMRKLKKYVYPYISSASDVVKGDYPYPIGYDTKRELSPAGGGEGGNPDLFEVAAVIQASLTNLGDIPGACVVQAYISFPPNLVDQDGAPVDMPVRVLRAFDKKNVSEPSRIPLKLELTRRDLSYWDVKQQNWVLPEGEFTVHLGFSSRDLPLKSTFEPLMGLNFGGGNRAP